MKSHPDKHPRRSIRLKGYDYTQNGAYFVTICTQNRECLFGEIVDEEMMLNEAGKMVGHIWKELPTRFPSVELDAFVVMPNHIHGIIFIVGAPLAAPLLAAPLNHPIGVDVARGAASSATTLTLGKIMRAFKSISAIGVNCLLLRSNHPLWQRNYYEHIIRDEDKLNLIRQYILENPLRWEMDRENLLARVTKNDKDKKTWKV